MVRPLHIVYLIVDHELFKPAVYNVIKSGNNLRIIYLNCACSECEWKAYSRGDRKLEN